MARPDPTSGSVRETSRGHASRIDRSYYHRPTALLRGRRWLVLLALVASAGWAAFALSDKSHHVAPGAVVAAHAAWENECEVCHVPLSPIRAGGWQEGILAGATTHRSKCEACHTMPTHSPRQAPTAGGNCAECHVDHRGRDADISRVADATCTACHGDITAHLGPGADVVADPVVRAVTGFDAAHHPPFASLATDPGRVKFSHGRHMRAGLTVGPGDGTDKVAWTYARLSDADRGRYMPTSSSAKDLVQLDCASCHEFASDVALSDLRPVSALLAGLAPGAIALPVEFERHCAACHRLPGISIAPGAVVDDTVSGADRAGPARGLRHGLDADDLRRFVEVAALANARPEPAESGTRPLPAAHRPAASAEPGEDDALRAAVGAGRLFVRGVCEKCHEVDPVSLDAGGSLVAALAGDRTPQEGWFGVGTSRIPVVWFGKARFDHAAHRAWSCRECHAEAYPPEVPPADVLASSPLDQAKVLIGGMETCVRCHGPRGRDAVTGRDLGGARTECVECHTYHGAAPHGSSSFPR